MTSVIGRQKWRLFLLAHSNSGTQGHKGLACQEYRIRSSPVVAARGIGAFASSQQPKVNITI